MVTKKTYLPIIAFLLISMLFVGCQQTNGSAESNKPGTIVDSMGREVFLDKTPEKIVSLSPSNTEILFALGLGDKVVGVSEYTDYPEEAQNLPVVGAFNDPNVELILDTEPDLVIMGDKLQADTMKKLESLNIPFAAIEGTTFEEVIDSIHLLGKLLGKQDKAQEITKDMKNKAQKVQDDVKDADKPTAYFVMFYGQDNYTSGPGSFVNELIEMAGGETITKDAPVPWPNYSLEKLVEKDPDILLVSSDLGDLEGVKSAEGYKELTAVKEDRVYMIDANTVTRPGPRLADGLESIAKILHPDLVE